MEGDPPPAEDSIPALVSKLIDDSEQFVRTEVKLYRARLVSRLADARNAIMLSVLALCLAQAIIVAGLVGVLLILRRGIGPSGATAVVVGAGLALAALLGWLAWRQLLKATEIKDREKKP